MKGQRPCQIFRTLKQFHRFSCHITIPFTRRVSPHLSRDFHPDIAKNSGISSGDREQCPKEEWSNPVAEFRGETRARVVLIGWGGGRRGRGRGYRNIALQLGLVRVSRLASRASNVSLFCRSCRLRRRFVAFVFCVARHWNLSVHLVFPSCSESTSACFTDLPPGLRMERTCPWICEW